MSERVSHSIYARRRPDISHTLREIGNEAACQKLVRLWVRDAPETKSSLVIPLLHAQLMDGVEAYQRKGLVPLPPGVYRNTDLKTGGSPENFYVRGLDVAPTMQKYTHDLDIVMHKEPSLRNRLSEAIHDAAWAYYTFVRIHPMLDGNGRVGRMILKAVLEKRGDYEDIPYKPVDSDKSAKDSQLDALQEVDETGNLAPLEVFLAKQLYVAYNSKDDAGMREQLNKIIEERSRDKRPKQDLTAVWNGFAELDLYGVA